MNIELNDDGYVTRVVSKQIQEIFRDPSNKTFKFIRKRKWLIIDNLNFIKVIAISSKEIKCFFSLIFKDNENNSLSGRRKTEEFNLFLSNLT